MTTNGVCIDRWYVMIIFSCLTRTVSMHFDGLFDCSKGHFNRQSLKAVVRHESFYIVFKRNQSTMCPGEIVDTRQSQTITLSEL